MLRFAKTVCWLALLAVGAQQAAAFSLLGPVNEAYQVGNIAYNLAGDAGAPKNLGEEFRRNTPVLYYSVDANFLDYFGSNGVYAVDQAFAVFNALTNVSAYSGTLSEFPLEAQGLNYQAQALTLFDLKSVTMNFIIEQMGLAEPDRYTWTLHDRYLPPGGTCPLDEIYLVVKRNFDPNWSNPDLPQPSIYVNGTLYTYNIVEYCTGPDPLADAVEFPVDPTARTFTAVASGAPLWGTGLEYGGYYTGLTRDDVGGLRYLMRASNLNVEPAGDDTLTIATNLAVSQLLVSSNLNAFVEISLTNDAAALVTLYPNLIILNSQPIFTNVVTTNLVAWYGLPWYPATVPQLMFATNYTTNVATFYAHTFGNVVTNTYYQQGKVTILTTNVGFGGPWSPPGTLTTNVTATTVTSNIVTGDFFILPTNSNCGFSIISTQLVRTVMETNTPIVATNAPQVTNVTGQQFSQSYVTYWTNHIYVIHPVTCESNSVALRQGVEQIRFVRRDFDSLLNRFFHPITNEYWLTAVTNSRPVPQRVMRTIATPDFLITAQDLAAGPAGVPTDPWGLRGVNYTTNSYPGLAGPGTIVSPQAYTLNKVGPTYMNPGFFNFFVDYPFSELTHSLIYQWGSFDGSTNAPIVYPNGTDITNLERQVFIEITPVYLPNAHLTPTMQVPNTFYSAQMSATSYTPNFGPPPYTWSLAPGSPGLPPGLNLSAAGLISGTPTAEGFFDFVIRVTDSLGRTVDRSFFIKVEP